MDSDMGMKVRYSGERGERSGLAKTFYAESYNKY